MKKLLTVFSLLVLALVVVGCKPATDDTDDTITLTYVAHNLGTVEEDNIERRMVKAFDDAHENIVVKITERPKVADKTDPEKQIDQDWTEFLSAQAASGKFPDVFPIFESGADNAARGWAYDLKDVVKDDADFKALPEGLKQAGQYKGAQYALVTSQFNYGYVVNQTLIEKYAGTDAKLTYGVTLDDFLEVAEDVHAAAVAEKADTAIKGADGISTEWFNWLPSAYDTTLGYYAWQQDLGFGLNTTGFKSAMAKIVEQQGQAYIMQNMETGMFENGELAAAYINTANLKTLMGKTKEADSALYEAKLDWIGIPSVNGNSPVPSIIDLIAVGRGTQHPKEAYEFAKWMTFGLEGYAKRIELTKSTESLTFGPLIDNEAGDFAKKFALQYADLPEYNKFLEEHTLFIPEGGKVVPGYWAARQPIFGPFASRPDATNASVGDLMWDAAHGALPNYLEYLERAQKLTQDALVAQQKVIDSRIAALGD